MRPLRFRKIGFILALASIIAVGFGAVVPKALAGDSDGGGCSVHLLEGSFGYAFQGFINTGPPVPPFTFTPIGAYALFAAAGTISFDGKGNVQGVDSINLGWGGFPRTYQGTYEVVDATAKPKDCAFTSTFTESPGPGHPDHLYMVLAGDGNVLEFVNTTSNDILAGKADRK